MGINSDDGQLYCLIRRKRGELDRTNVNSVKVKQDERNKRRKWFENYFVPRGMNGPNFFKKNVR